MTTTISAAALALQSAWQSLHQQAQADKQAVQLGRLSIQIFCDQAIHRAAELKNLQRQACALGLNLKIPPSGGLGGPQ